MSTSRSADTAETRLELRNVDVRFGGVVAVNDVSLNLGIGEIAGLVGPNGAGKTTLIDAITGFVRYRGSIEITGVGSLDGLPAHRRSRLGIARAWQTVELLDELTVLENVWLADDRLTARKVIRGLMTGHQGTPSDQVISTLQYLGLDAYRDRRPTELSTGQRRLVALARALVAQARFIVMDEPTAGLIEAEAERMCQQLRRVADDGVGILIVEHDSEMVLAACDTLHVMELGRMMVSGPAAEVRADPLAVSIYFGSLQASTTIVGAV